MKQIVLFWALLALAGGRILAQESPDSARQAAKFLEWSELDPEDKYPQGSRNYFISQAHGYYYKGKFHKAADFYHRADSLNPIQDTLILRNYQDAARRSGTRNQILTRKAKKNLLRLKGSINPVLALNSKQSDFGYLAVEDKAFYISSKIESGVGSRLRYYFNKQPYLDIYTVEDTTSQDTIEVDLPGSVHTKMHDGPLYLSPNQEWLFVTHNYYFANQEDQKNLYIDYYQWEEGEWGDPEVLSFCHESYSVQHPTFWPASQTLTFSSNKPGGYGGFDLYSTTYSDTGWSRPENLGPVINSVYDEVFPFFDPQGRLGFSTNRLGSLGGLDLVTFRSGRLYYYDQPLNTTDDDFGLFYKTADSLYLASNRNNDYFNDDIWLFTRQDSIEEFQIDTTRKITQRSTKSWSDTAYLTAAGGTIALPSGDSLERELAGRDQQISIDTIGHWPAEFSLAPSGDLTVVSGLAPGTYSFKYQRCGTGKFSTCDTLQKTVVISPFVKGAGDTLLVPSTGVISQLTQNDQINGAPAGAGSNATVEVLGQWPPGIHLNSDGTVEVDAGMPPGIHNLSYLLCDTSLPPTCDTVPLLVKKLDSSLTLTDLQDKPLQPTGLKDTAKAASIQASAPSLSTGGPKDTAKTASIGARAPSLSLLKVYFWNDSPGPRNRQPETNTTYREAYEILQDSIPKVVQLKGNPKVSDFRRETRSAWLDLRQVVEEIRANLKKGKSVELTLIGFASKRGPAVYNKALSGRRIRSLENHIFEELGDLSASARSRLAFTKTVRGEREGGKEPSLNDRVSSVYSVQSALQRYVEIRVSY